MTSSLTQAGLEPIPKGDIKAPTHNNIRAASPTLSPFFHRLISIPLSPYLSSFFRLSHSENTSKGRKRRWAKNRSRRCFVFCVCLRRENQFLALERRRKGTERERRSFSSSPFPHPNCFWREKGELLPPCALFLRKLKFLFPGPKFCYPLWSNSLIWPFTVRELPRVCCMRSYPINSAEKADFPSSLFFHRPKSESHIALRRNDADSPSPMAMWGWDKLSNRCFTKKQGKDRHETVRKSKTFPNLKTFKEENLGQPSRQRNYSKVTRQHCSCVDDIARVASLLLLLLRKL